MTKNEPQKNGKQNPAANTHPKLLLSLSIFNLLPSNKERETEWKVWSSERETERIDRDDTEKRESVRS